MIKTPNGSTFYTVGPKGKVVFSVTDENKDTQNILYYEQGKVETMKLKKWGDSGILKKFNSSHHKRYYL